MILEIPRSVTFIYGTHSWTLWGEQIMLVICLWFVFAVYVLARTIVPPSD